MKVVDKRILSEYLKSYIPQFTIDEIEDLIEIPPASINYNYAFPVFRLAKFEKKDPKLIAQELVERFQIPSFIQKIEAKGPYLNFQVKNKLVLENIFELKETYGKIQEIRKDKKFNPVKVVIEYPSPNTNKPLHLGHVRNMLLGNSVYNLFKYLGHTIYQVNLNNDRGIHICKSMLAYQKWGQNEEPNKKSDHFVGDYYIKYSQKEEEDPSILKQVKEMLKKWEEGDPEIRALWEKMNKWALKGFHETYEKFGISFDKEYYESEFYYKGKDLILEGLKKGIFEKGDEGEILAKLENKYDLPNKVLLRSDGTSIYITQDIYLANLKKEDFNPDLSIFVVGNEQDLYFKQLFAVLEMLNFKENKYHLSYGMISLPEGKMKSREGTVVDADDILEKMQNLAYKEVDKRYPDLSEQEKDNRAKIIGMAGLRFFILKYSPRTDFVFNPKESISFEGETGPYIQYCYARIESIINKSQENISLDIDFERFTHEKELDLIKNLNYFPEIIQSAIQTYGIHLIPQYLLTLGQSFNSFYSSCPVISENKELERARLLLIKCVQIVINIGLKILGIEILESM